jgi:hypothetical protein
MTHALLLRLNAVNSAHTSILPELSRASPYSRQLHGARAALQRMTASQAESRGIDLHSAVPREPGQSPEASGDMQRCFAEAAADCR